MREGYHFYQPSEGHQLAHDPMNSIIAPRPIGWISSISQEGHANLAPYSFFNLFNYKPPIIGFASIGYKDSVSNIEAMQSFCYNLVSRRHLDAMNLSSQGVSSSIDEFELAGLTKNQGSIVDVPYIADCPVVMECRKTQIIRLTDSAGNECDTWLVLGEVVGIHIDKTLLTEGTFQISDADPILRAGGPGDYYTITASNKFVLSRP